MDRALFQETLAARPGGGATFDTVVNGGVGTTSVKIPPLCDLWVFSRSGNALRWSIIWRNGTKFTTPSGILSRFHPWDGTVVESISLSAADADVWYLVVAHGTPPPQVALTSLTDLVSAALTSGPPITVPDAQSFGPTSLAGSSAEAVKVAGAANVPDGALIRLALGGSGASLTAEATNTYVALKGHSSGIYIAVAFLGMTSPPSIRKNTGQSEPLDLVWANADSAAHFMAGSWSAEVGD